MAASDRLGDRINLDFDGHNTLYATHGLHAFAAKCPPQLARFGIENYSRQGETVLDPMAGSGTTLVEASLLGRNAIGFDLDPLSCLIARVKSRRYPLDEIDTTFNILVGHIQGSIARADEWDGYKEYIPQEYPNLDYWFDSGVQKMLAVILLHITETPMNGVLREFFWAAFSSLILSKVSVANARDIIHSRHHFYRHDQAPDVLERFKRRVAIMRRQIAEYSALLGQTPETITSMQQGDARVLPLQDDAMDLIFTSPPYATALDYTRAHFLAVGWMRRALGIDLAEYKARGTRYIGSERGRISARPPDDQPLVGYPLAVEVIERLREVDTRQASLIQRYFLDMSQVMAEMQRVLRPGKHALIVVCPSHIRKIQVPTQKILIEIGSSVGLELVEEHTRTISARRRVMPYSRETFGDRMSTEYVLVFRKHGS